MSADDRFSHPSLHHRRSSSSQSQIIHPPTGFAWTGSGSFGHPSQAPPYPSGPEPQSESSKTKRSKDKGKEKDKSRSRDKHQPRHKERHEYPPPNMDSHASQKPNGFSPSFGATHYSNEPASTESHYMPIRGHHPPNYPPEPPHLDYSRPGDDRYRRDYDMQRRPSAPSNAYQPRSLLRDQYPTDYHLNQRMDTSSPVPPMTMNDRHHEPYGHHEQPHTYHNGSHAPSIPREQQRPEPARPKHSTKQNVMRLITILIDDLRWSECQLAELRLPTKERGDGQAWVDALDLTEVLQSGPSRIDGPAKVSTMRGEYKQIFLRVSAEGEVDCKSANLQVSSDKTIKLIVEDPDRRYTSHQHRRYSSTGMLTPVTDTMAGTPDRIPAPHPVVPYSVDRLTVDQYEPSINEQPPLRSPPSRKRRRSPSSPAPDLRQVSGLYTSPDAHYCHNSDRTEPAEPSAPVQYTPSPEQKYYPPPPASSGSGQGALPSSSHPVPLSSGPAPTPGPAVNPHVSPAPQASPNTYPSSVSQISPLSQTGSLAQMSPASISVSTMSHSQEAHSPLRLTPTRQGQGAFSSYSPHGSAGPSSQNVSPPQGPPVKKQRHSTEPAEHQGPSPRAVSGPPPPMASLTPPAPEPIAPAPANSTFAQYAHSQHPQFGGQPPPSAPIPVPHPSQWGNQTNAVVAAPGSVTGALPQAKVDDAVALFLRGIFKIEPGFAAYIEAKNKNLPVSQYLPHLQYVQSKFDQWVGRPVPEGVSGAAGGTPVTKAQICQAFYQPNPTWGEECTEVLSLTHLYGPGGVRGADPEAVDLCNEPEVVTTTLQMRGYLAQLKKVHARWVAEHPEQH